MSLVDYTQEYDGGPKSGWDLPPWRHHGDMNMEYTHGELGVSKNGTGVTVSWRANGKPYGAWVDARALVKLLTDGKHGDFAVLHATGYCLGDLEPGGQRSGGTGCQCGGFLCAGYSRDGLA